jgi:hypothetical protein
MDGAGTKALIALEIAAGIILGLIIWTMVGPMITTVSPAPSA